MFHEKMSFFDTNLQTYDIWKVKPNHGLVRCLYHPSASRSVHSKKKSDQGWLPCHGHVILLIKVPITPKSFFRLNKSLHLFETHCTFLPLFNPNIDLLHAVKVMKSGHHLSHDRASKGYGSIPCLTSQTYLHVCLQRLSTMQISLWHQTRNIPMPLTSSVVWQMMARFRNFYNVKKSQELV